MYSWIWRRLPFGLPGKLTGSMLIIATVAASLWLWVFPWLEPLLPFDDVRVEPAGPGVSAPSSTVPDDPYAVPYSTATNNPAAPTPTSTPTPSATRSP